MIIGRVGILGGHFPHAAYSRLLLDARSCHRADEEVPAAGLFQQACISCAYRVEGRHGIFASADEQSSGSFDERSTLARLLPASTGTAQGDVAMAGAFDKCFAGKCTTGVVASGSWDCTCRTQPHTHSLYSATRTMG